MNENHSQEASPILTTNEPESLLPETSADETVAALPEADLPEPPRPLVAGAFLGGEYEVKELVARGLTNYYLAHGGDPYVNPIPKLVAERERIQERREARDMSPEHPVPAFEAALFPEAQYIAVQDREYLVFDWVDTIPLQDWREVANDARYLRTIGTAVAGLAELESHNLTADFTRETLQVSEDGELRYYGFIDALSPNQPQAAGIRCLGALNTFLLRHVFGEGGTIRLDDQWGALPMSEEVKEFARLLDEEYSSLNEVVVVLQPLIYAKPLQADAALLSDVGQEREVNEDSGLIVRLARAGHQRHFDVELYAVSDGMGGHEGGEVASALTLNTLQLAIINRADLNWDDNVAVRNALGDIIEEVNAAVLALTEEPKYRATRAKPGATLTFALRIGSRLFVGNVGDSRAYRWNLNGGLQRLTKDHSYVQTLIDSGELAEEDAFEHPDGSIITAHIGMQKLKQRDVFLRLVSPGDKILIVSDGVIDMLRESEFEPVLNIESPHEICRALVDGANTAGGYDNITAVCVNFS
jgi:serine/threonine protein phosphatase PrpC